MTTPGYPLIAWGDAATFTASTSGADWVSGCSPVLGATGGQSDPFGGTSAYLLENTSTTSTACVTYHANTAWPSSSGLVAAYLKAGTAAVTDMGLVDITAGITRARLRATWSGGTPSVAVVEGTGTALTPISVGGSWWLLRLWVPASVLVVGNGHRPGIYPSGSGTMASGTVSVYVRNAVTLNPLDAMLGYAEEREGHRKVRAPSGVYDVWDGGTDYYLDAVARFVPAHDTTDPNVSGWYGTNPIPGVNCGVQAMLTAGRKGYDLIYCPDRADASDSITSELVEPMEGGVELAPNGQRHVTFTLRNTSSEYPAYDT